MHLFHSVVIRSFIFFHWLYYKTLFPKITWQKIRITNILIGCWTQLAIFKLFFCIYYCCSFVFPLNKSLQFQLILLVLHCFTAVLAQPGWQVIYHQPEDICAVRGSTVSINCTYKHPATEVYDKSFWFIVTQEDPMGKEKSYDTQLPLYKQPCNSNICTLKILNVSENNSALYRFRFFTTSSDGKYTGLHGVGLTVSGETLIATSSACLHLLTTAPEVTTVHFFQIFRSMWGVFIRTHTLTGCHVTPSVTWLVNISTPGTWMTSHLVMDKPLTYKPQNLETNIPAACQDPKFPLLQCVSFWSLLLLLALLQQTTTKVWHDEW